MTLLVNLEKRWLVDVGFGDSFLKPLLLDERSEQSQGDHAYDIVTDGSYLVLIRRDGRESNEWRPQYRFTLQPYEYDDFVRMCHYHQTSPQSHFTQGRICSRATEEGRITLSDMRLITTSKNGRQERTLENHQEYAATLRKHFGIVMTSNAGVRSMLKTLEVQR